MKANSFFQPQKQSFLPRISRFFSAPSFFWPILGLAVGILASIYIFTKPDLLNTLSGRIVRARESMGPNRALLVKEYEYWVLVTEEKPDYRDAYLEASQKAQALGLDEKSHELWQKAKSLDPTLSLP